MTPKSPTLFWYIGRQFIVNLVGFIISLLCIIYLFESIELMRRLAKRGSLDFGVLLKMGFFKLPEVGLELFPFAVLFASIFTFWRLTRSHELVIIRAAGMSAWQFMMPIMTLAVVVAVTKIALINPISSVLIRQFEQLEAQHLSKGSAIDLATTGLWLKQPTDDGQAIIHAPRVQSPQWILSDVIVYFYDRQLNLTHRLDSPSAQLTPGAWIFDKPVINRVGTIKPIPLETARLNTDLTLDEIESRFSSPQTVSFWQLPNYIRILESTGFSSNTLRAHYFSLLSEPILYVALVLLAAALSLRPPRQNNNWTIILGSIGVAFLVFFMGDVLQAFGISDMLPIVVAAFAPALISLMIGVAAILHLEDG